MTPISILLNGSEGRMGQSIKSIASEENATITASINRGEDLETSIDKCDAIIDFSVHSATLPLVKMAVRYGKPVIIGTTGHSQEEQRSIISFSQKTPIVWTGNYSIGINLLNHLVGQAAHVLPSGYDIEVIDKHHRYKKDAPSGTTELLLTTIRETKNLSKEKECYGRKGITSERSEDEIGVHSIRAGDIVGEHTVFFAGDGERIELKHCATDRRIFARGAIRAAHWILKQNPGLYTMKDVLNLS